MTWLDNIEARMMGHAVAEPHPEDHPCQMCSDARDIAVLIMFARGVETLAKPQWRSMDYDRNALIDDIRALSKEMEEK